MILKHTLPNGVRVVAESIPYVRSVAFGLWVGTGSRYETWQNNGISHFLEHMMFKGTENRTARQLAETFDEIGGQVNAFTSKEITCYYAKVLDEHLMIAVDVLADMFFRSLFDPEEIRKEQKVVDEEIRMVEDTPDDVVHDRLSSVALEGHPLGWSVLGRVENLRRFDRSLLLDYKSRRYRPQELVIACAGNLPENYLDMIEAHFGDFQGGPAVSERVKPEFTGGISVKKKETEQSHICLGLPGIPAGDQRIYSYILLNNLVGGNMSSRLFQEVREERGLAYSVYSYHSAYSDTGLFTIYAGTSPDQENEVIRVILGILDEIRNHGITAEELAKGKEQLKGSLMMSLESTNNRMSRLGKNELLLGRHKSMDEVVEAVESLTREDLLEAARSIFSHPLALSVISPGGTVPPAYRRDALAV
ncbi:putative Zn-dependent peptidase [Melghirimyces profundicolus]|uniref:Putative Zn-dependent peptidase n=1 Tax=Melghirimyces profundicolus TaxID=1242148 RepID=A0A2T6BRG5_9BACL|nr:pitrilysin family protein [Melghirimyces profundicolus]PTX58632.1 putative Zn-dependent peptidase [Melghirimyces profundicolus]